MMARSSLEQGRLFVQIAFLALACGYCSSPSAQVAFSQPCQSANTNFRGLIGNQGIGWGMGSDRLWYAGERIWFSLGVPSVGEPKKMAIVIRETQGGPDILVAEAEFPGTVSFTIESHRYIYEIWVLVDWPSLLAKATLSDAGCDSAGEHQPFPWNIGVNDAWYVPNLDGHGVLLTIYPSIKKIFLALFTFDTERPGESAGSIFGDAGQRWITAIGPYEGDTAHLDIDLTMGGVFLQAEPMPEWSPGGTIDLQLNHCNDITLDYHIPSINRQGTLQLQRVAQDRVALCELLSVQGND